MTKTVGIGFIGTGFARTVQMPAFAACEGAKLVSVASGSLENAAEAAKQFGIEHFTADWHETVQHPEVDLVCVTTPPRMHRDMVLEAIWNGKHVLAEKPMAMKIAQAEEMTAAAAKAGVLALIDHELRFQPGRQKVWSMLREGAIGKVRHAKYNFRAPHRGDPNVAWNWWSDREEGGGSLGAINSHIIDSFNWFLDARINSLFCQLHTHVMHRPHGEDLRQVTTDDEAHMLLKFADGPITSSATGLVSVSMVEQPDYVNQIEFFGTDGAIRVEHRGEVYVAKNGDKGWTELEVDLAPALDGVPDTGFARGFLAFAPKIVEAIATGATTIEHAATFEDGLQVQQVLDAARESSAKRFVVIRD